MVFKKGQTPWNKGLKGVIHASQETKDKISYALSGLPATSGAFKKGHVPWHAGTKGLMPAPSNVFKKGYIPWHDGTKGVYPPNKGCFKKGHPAPKTAFKKGHITFATNPSKLELIIQKKLSDLNILFRTQERIIGTPDIFIEPDLCIFIDGVYWHGLERVKKRDKIVNNELIRQGFRLLRFSEEKISKNIDKVLATIIANIHDA